MKNVRKWRMWDSLDYIKLQIFKNVSIHVTTLIIAHPQPISFFHKWKTRFINI